MTTLINGREGSDDTWPASSRYPKNSGTLATFSISQDGTFSMQFGHVLQCFTRKTMTTSQGHRRGPYLKANPVDTMIRESAFRRSSVMPTKNTNIPF